MHLYGGAAAMLDDVMRVQWEVEVYCARVVLCQSYLRDVLGDIILVGKVHGRCTYMVKPPDGFLKYRIQEWWKGRQVHLNGGAASGECVVGVGWWYL